MAVLPKNGVRYRNAPRGLGAEEIRRRQNPTWASAGEQEYDPRSRVRRARDAFGENLREEIAREFDEDPKRPTDRRLGVDARDRSWAETLRSDIDRAGVIYGQRLGRSDVFAINDPLERQKAIQLEHRQYGLMMMAAMIAPLRNKPDDKTRVNAVLTSVGMGVGMWLRSPAFRKEVRNLPRTTMEMWDEHVQEKIKLKVEAKTNQGQRVGKYLQARYDRVMQAQEGGHAPFSDYSAALTLVSMSDQLYDKLREPGADTKRLTDAYSQTVEGIYAQATRDGVDPAAVDSCMRYIVGRRMVDEPTYANRYSHTAYDQVRRTPAVEREVELPDGTTETQKVWDGSFMHRDGGTIKPNDPGYFAPRLPADPQEHVDYMDKAILADFKTATSPADLQKVLLSYSAARLPSFQGETRELADGGGDGYPLEIVQRVDRMFELMEDDHYDINERHQLYNTSMTRAMISFEELRPELVQEWSTEYGEHWDRFQEMLANPMAGDARMAEELREVREAQRARERAEREARREESARRAREEAAKPREHGQSEARARLGERSRDRDVVDVEVVEDEHGHEPDVERVERDASTEPVSSPEFEVTSHEESVETSGNEEYEFEDEEFYEELGDDPYANEAEHLEDLARTEHEEEVSSSSSSSSTKTSSRQRAQSAQRAQQAQDRAERAERIRDESRDDADRTDRDAGHDDAGRSDRDDRRGASTSRGAGREAKRGFFDAKQQRMVRQQTKSVIDDIAASRQEKGHGLGTGSKLPTRKGVELTPAERMLAQRRAASTARRTAGKKSETITKISLDQQLDESRQLPKEGSLRTKDSGPSL